MELSSRRMCPLSLFCGNIFDELGHEMISLFHCDMRQHVYLEFDYIQVISIGGKSILPIQFMFLKAISNGKEGGCLSQILLMDWSYESEEILLSFDFQIFHVHFIFSNCFLSKHISGHEENLILNFFSQLFNFDTVNLYLL